MARYRADIPSPKTPEAAFEYLARFSNAVEWDPTVVRAEMVTPAPVGRGSAFELVIRTGRRESTWRYEIIEHDPPQRVVLRAERGALVSEDTITVRPAPNGGSIATYDADLRLRGLLRIADPLLAIAFRRLGDRAAAGLRRELAGGTA